jgi:A/G-specific adenine glycosylase
MARFHPFADAAVRAAVRRRLLAWFDRHARDLPWRRSRDPYAIWISEVMLQQTQVATVIPYFTRFLEAFPDIAALAAANEQHVLRHWEGLGYYRRARALHQAARQLCFEHGGRIPNDPAALGLLPGLGRYTVNAVLSQAFERRLPILEANSRRVLCRLLGVRGDPRAATTERKLWGAAEALLPRRRVGAFNQALMELGALVCTPDSPACDRCPLTACCIAQRRGWQAKIPRKAPAPRVEEVHEVAVALWKNRKMLLVQCPDGGRWAGMWELPRCAVPRSQTPAAVATALLARLGLRAKLGPELAAIRHGVTRFRITLICLHASFRGGAFRPGVYPTGRWVAPAQLSEFPLSRPQRQIALALTRQAHGSEPRPSRNGERAAS